VAVRRSGCDEFCTASFTRARHSARKIARLAMSAGEHGYCHAKSRPLNPCALASSMVESMNVERRSGSAAIAEKAALEELV